MEFTASYGVVGLAVVEKEFIAEGINEAGLSAGLFFFPRYGSYVPYDSRHNHTTIADLQLVQWMLSQFSSIDEVKEAIAAGADIIMLDNMSNEAMTEAVEVIKAADKGIKTEASGNMSIPRLVEVAATGVDYISVGALTHTVKGMDISMNIQVEK